MKYLQIIIIFIFIWSNSYSQKITIDAFENANSATFSDNQQNITTKSVQEGFEIEIKKLSGIKKIQQLNAAGNFIDINGSTEIVDGKLYIIKNALIENNKIRIKLIKGIEEKMLILSVSALPSPVVVVTHTCTPIKLPDTCRVQRNYDNNFGEQVKYYDKRKIVYVYDFNVDTSKREFYKITRTKIHNTQQINQLKIELKFKNAIRKKAKIEFDQDKTSINKKAALLIASKEVEAQKVELSKSKDKYGLKIELANFNKETLTPGKNVKIKIHNINKFMFDVSIADSVIHFDSEPSAFFTQFFLGDSNLLGSLMSSFSDNIKIQSIGLEELNKKIKCFVEKYNWLQSKVLDAYDPCYSFPCCYSIEYIELANDLAVIRSDAVNIQMKLDANKKIVDDNKKELDACEKNEKDVKSNAAALVKCENSIKDLKQKLSSLTGDDRKKKEEELSKEEENCKKLNEDKSKLDNIQSDKCTNFKIDEYKKKKLAAEMELSEISVISTLLNNLPSDMELKRIIVFLRNMVEQNNSHTSDYISLNGNMLDLKITITSKDSIFKYFSIPETKSEPISIQIPIVGKPFASFSTGSFLAVGKHLQNKIYDWQATVGRNNIADSSSYTLVESGYTLPSMGFCALGSIEWKLSRSFGMGSSVGVGLSIEKNPKLAYLTGISLFLGDLRQFAITGGFIGMQVNKLTNNFQIISDNQTIYSSNQNIDYYKEFKVGGFVSLTYTPFKVYKTKTVKSKNK